jgi:hypothetical protein
MLRFTTSDLLWLPLCKASGYDRGMRFTLKELLLLVAFAALGMGAFEIVKCVDSHDPTARISALIAFWVLASTALSGAFGIILGAVVRYHLSHRRNSQG